MMIVSAGMVAFVCCSNRLIFSAVTYVLLHVQRLSIGRIFLSMLFLWTFSGHLSWNAERQDAHVDELE